MKRYIHDKSAVDMLHEFETKLDEMKAPKFNKEEEEVESSFDPYNSEDYYLSDGWETVRSKAVYDSDGFLTDYTLWYNNETDEWCTVFGDKDLYHPWDSYHDMDFDNEDDAEDWFADYDTDYEDE